MAKQIISTTKKTVTLKPKTTAAPSVSMRIYKKCPICGKFMGSKR